MYDKELIEKYRHTNVDHDEWSEWVITPFKEAMLDIGVEVDSVLWSGFYSQGDGACFTGLIYDWGKYLLHLGYNNPILIQTATDEWHFKVYHANRYYHHKSVNYDNEIFLPDNPYNEETDALRHDAWINTMQQFDLLMLEQDIIRDLEDHMKEVYKKLQEGYEYLTSDEMVIDFIKHNLLEEEI